MAGSSTEMAILQRVAERGSFAGATDDVGLWPWADGLRLIFQSARPLGSVAEAAPSRSPWIPACAKRNERRAIFSICDPPQLSSLGKCL